MYVRGGLCALVSFDDVLGVRDAAGAGVSASASAAAAAGDASGGLVSAGPSREQGGGGDGGVDRKGVGGDGEAVAVGTAILGERDEVIHEGDGKTQCNEVEGWSRAKVGAGRRGIAEPGRKPYCLLYVARALGDAFSVICSVVYCCYC